MKYYIAHPAPIEYIKKEIETELDVSGHIHEKNNQVFVVETDLDKTSLEQLLDGLDFDLIVINDTLEDWI